MDFLGDTPARNRLEHGKVMSKLKRGDFHRGEHVTGILTRVFTQCETKHLRQSFKSSFSLSASLYFTMTKLAGVRRTAIICFFERTMYWW